MSLIHIIHVPEVEEIITKDLRDYIWNESGWNTLVTNFANPTISQEHPFAQLIDLQNSNPNGTIVVPANMFPCVAVQDLSESPAAEAPMTTEQVDVNFGVNELADIVANPAQYIINGVDLATLTAIVNSHGAIAGTGAEGFWRSMMTLEIWADQAKVKNLLFYMVQAYFLGPRRFTLVQTQNLSVKLDALTADKTGVYNFDWGVMLYGAMIRVPIDYPFATYTFDTTIPEITKIAHSAPVDVIPNAQVFKGSK